MTAKSTIALVWPDVRKISRCKRTILFWIPTSKSILDYRLRDIIPEWYPTDLVDSLFEKLESTLDIRLRELSSEESGYLAVLLIQSNSRLLPVRISVRNGFNNGSIRKVKIKSTEFTQIRIAHFSIDIDLYQIYKLRVLFR